MAGVVQVKSNAVDMSKEQDKQQASERFEKYLLDGRMLTAKIFATREVHRRVLTSEDVRSKTLDAVDALMSRAKKDQSKDQILKAADIIESFKLKEGDVARYKGIASTFVQGRKLGVDEQIKVQIMFYLKKPSEVIFIPGM
jgi:hypothetical protein